MPSVDFTHEILATIEGLVAKVESLDPATISKAVADALTQVQDLVKRVEALETLVKGQEKPAA